MWWGWDGDVSKEVKLVEMGSERMAEGNGQWKRKKKERHKTPQPQQPHNTKHAQPINTKYGNK
jgi:hypothetical protein